MRIAMSSGLRLIFRFPQRLNISLRMQGPEKTIFTSRNHLGFSRNVIVQASCHGTDNSATLHAIASNRAEWPAALPLLIQLYLRRLNWMRFTRAAFVACGLTFLKRLVDNAPKDKFLEVATRIERLGWHVVVYFEADLLMEQLTPFIEAIPTHCCCRPHGAT